MILHSPDVLRLLQNNTNIKVQDLEDLWNWLDNDGSGEVTIDEFMQGFQWLNETFKPKTLMRLHRVPLGVNSGGLLPAGPNFVSDVGGRPPARLGLHSRARGWRGVSNFRSHAEAREESPI